MKKFKNGKLYERNSCQFKFRLPLKITKKQKWYVSSCPVLDVFSQGETAEKAKENLVEALQAFFLSCIKRETLDGVLRTCGFIAGPSRFIPQAEDEIFPRGKYVDIPIPHLFKKRLSPPGCHPNL